MKKGKTLALTAAIAGLLTGGVEAAETTSVYTLAPVTVTATRYEKHDVDVASSTQTFTAADIEKTGADNMSSALQYLDGVVTAGMGPNGTAISSMTSKTVIRGVDNGTLVMINGTPINWRSLYNLEDIPTSAVERVEVVRGGGAVLYGSQATGGVINIITKKKMPNEVQAGLGNFARQDYKASTNVGNLSVAYNYNKWGDTGLVSKYVTSFTDVNKVKVPVDMMQRFKGYEKNDFLATYKLNDNMDFLYNHNTSKNNWEYTYNNITKPNYMDLNGKARYYRQYERQKDFVQFNLHDLNGVSGHAFYNYNTLESKGIDFYGSNGSLYKTPKLSNSKEFNRSYGYDVQKVWKQDAQTFLLGTSLIRETYESDGNDYGRNIWSAFGSWDKNLTDKDNLTLSARGTWTTGVRTFQNFSGQAQYLHKLTDHQSVYASVGQSFVLPTFSQMYADSNRIIGNPDLKPQKGLHYELGWKLENEGTEYKIAAFSEKIDDNITFSKISSGTYKDYWNTVNEDFKNKGVELSVRHRNDNGFSWHAGMTFQDPKSKQSGTKSGIKKYWDRSYGRFLLNAGIAYEQDKWTTALNATYLADRVMTPTSTHSYDQKPYLLTSFTAKYSPNDTSDILFSLDNVLNRQDVISHTSSDYYATPRNFMLSYRYKF